MKFRSCPKHLPRYDIEESPSGAVYFSQEISSPNAPVRRDVHVRPSAGDGELLHASTRDSCFPQHCARRVFFAENQIRAGIHVFNDEVVSPNLDDLAVRASCGSRVVGHFSSSCEGH